MGKEGGKNKAKRLKQNEQVEKGKVGAKAGGESPRAKERRLAKGNRAKMVEEKQVEDKPLSKKEVDKLRKMGCIDVQDEKVIEDEVIDPGDDVEEGEGQTTPVIVDRHGRKKGDWGRVAQKS